MPKHIMIFNDAKEILIILESILSEAGYEVFLDTYGAAGGEYKRIESVSPDLLILDCSINSEAKAWEIVQQMKLVSTTAGIPVVMATTYPKKMEDIKGYLSTKRIAILPKPFEIDDLLAVIEQAFTLKNVMSDPNVD